MNVEKIMRKDVLWLRSEEAIDAAWRQLRDQRLEALPVTNSAGRLIGLLTERDLLARLSARWAPHWSSVITGATDRLAADYLKSVGVTVGEIMTRSPVTIVPETSVEEAAALMRQRAVGTLAVVGDDNTYLGIVTRGDVIDHLTWPTTNHGQAVEDSDLERSMRDGIDQAVWASKHGVTVEAHQGVIRMTGVVASPVERSALLAMARSCRGCTGVEDRLLVLSRAGRTI